MQIIQNTVMVKFDRENDELLLESGHKLHLSTTWEPYQHAVTSGIVTHLPEKIIFNRSNHSVSLQYDTDMELKIGDRVIFDFKVEELIKKSCEPINGSYPLRYDDIFVAIRGTDIIPVNGIVLVEACDAIEEEDVKRAMQYLHLPDTVIKEKSEVMGIVRYTGTPLRGYLHAPEELTEVYDEINVGDKVLFHQTYAIDLQYPLHQIIEKGKTLYRMRRKDMFAIVE